LIINNNNKKLSNQWSQNPQSVHLYEDFAAPFSLINRPISLPETTPSSYSVRPSCPSMPSLSTIKSACTGVIPSVKPPCPGAIPSDKSVCPGSTPSVQPLKCLDSEVIKTEPSSSKEAQEISNYNSWKNAVFGFFSPRIKNLSPSSDVQIPTVMSAPSTLRLDPQSVVAGLDFSVDLRPVYNQSIPKSKNFVVQEGIFDI